MQTQNKFPDGECVIHSVKRWNLFGFSKKTKPKKTPNFVSVPWICHNLQFDSFTSQVIEQQLGTWSPLSMDAAYQTYIQFGLITIKCKHTEKKEIVNTFHYLTHWEQHLSAGLQAVDDCISQWTL